MNRIRRTRHLFWVIFFDFLAAAISWSLFYLLRKSILNEDPTGFTITTLYGAFAVGVLWVIFVALASGYWDIAKQSRVKQFLNGVLTSLIHSIFVFFVLLLDDQGVDNYTAYYRTFSTYFLVHLVIVSIIKTIELSVLKRYIRKGSISYNTLLIGSNKKAYEIYKELQESRFTLGFYFVGYVHVFDKTKDMLNDELRHFGDYHNTAKIVRRCNIEQVIIALEPSEHKRIQQIINILEGMDVKISIIPDLYQILIGSVRVNHIFGVPLIEIKQQIVPVWQSVLKRLFDILFSSSVLVLGLPFFITVGIITKATSRGSMFFAQIRIGKDEKPFVIYKFRSMRTNAEKETGPALSKDDDPRITKWGKFMRKTRIDEVPQFWNVLKGDMSIVGPRPERNHYIKEIVKKAPHYRHLLKVRPGITSLGQVKYGYAENVDQMIKRLNYDILYIENMSLVMDFRIILFTVLIVFQGRGK